MRLFELREDSVAILLIIIENRQNNFVIQTVKDIINRTMYELFVYFVEGQIYPRNLGAAENYSNASISKQSSKKCLNL